MSGSRALDAVRGACLALALVFALGACADLGAIRQFADSAGDGAALPELADDYVAAAERQHRYAPEHLRGPAPVSPDPARAAQREQMLVLQDAIEAYMAALGALAADEAVRYDRQLDALDQALARTDMLGAAERDAGKRLSGLLLRASTDRWRRNRLETLIEQGHEPLLATVGGLRRIAEGAFLGEIDNEAGAMRAYYDGLRARSEDPAAIAAVTELEEFRRAELERRRRAVEAYIEVLDGIRAGHEALHAGRGDLARETLLVEIRRYGDDIRRAASSLRRIV